MPNTAGNYRLSATSPAIGAGNGTYNRESKDLAGNPRLFGAKIDMGAYEFNAYRATFKFGAPRPDSIAGVASPYLLTEPSPAPDSTG
jgi:hypothetical protein